MEESNSAIQPASVGEHDGWVVQSSSAVQPSGAALVESLSDGTIKAPVEAVQPGPPAEGVETATETPADADAVEEPPVETKPKRAKPFEKRVETLKQEVDRLTWQRREEERHIERLRSERTALTSPPAETPKPAAKPSQAPKWGDGAQWESWDAYQDARDTWVREEATAHALKAAETRLQSEQERFRQNAVIERHEARIAAAKAKYADWDTVTANLDQIPNTPFLQHVILNHEQGADVLHALGTHPEEGQVLASLQWTRPLADAVKAAPDPAALLLYFAQHPNEHRRIATLDPAPALMALGALSTRLAGAQSGSPAPVVSVSTANPPIRPVGGSRQAVASSGTLDDLPFEQYVEEKNRRELAARRQSH